MCKYEMDPTRIVAATERTRDLGQTDGATDERMDRRTDEQSETNITPKTSLCGGHKNIYF